MRLSLNHPVLSPKSWSFLGLFKFNSIKILSILIYSRRSMTSYRCFIPDIWYSKIRVVCNNSQDLLISAWLRHFIFWSFSGNLIPLVSSHLNIYYLFYFINWENFPWNIVMEWGHELEFLMEIWAHFRGGVEDYSKKQWNSLKNNKSMIKIRCSELHQKMVKFW